MLIGCSGWYYQDWKNSFYKDVAKSKWFAHYASVFDTVEINSSFYNFPKVATVKTWHRQAPSRFMYSVKANRGITHTKKFVGTKKLVNDFYKTVSILDEKLGCVLFQLPPMHYKKVKLKQIVSQLNPKYKNVVEFRHSSWWDPEVYEVLKENNIIFCIVSAPELPDDFVKTAKEIYVRFHGRTQWYDYRYSLKELKNWKEKMIKKAWIYFNNDWHANAVKNALQMRGLFKL